MSNLMLWSLALGCLGLQPSVDQTPEEALKSCAWVAAVPVETEEFSEVAPLSENMARAEPSEGAQPAALVRPFTLDLRGVGIVTPVASTQTRTSGGTSWATVDASLPAKKLYYRESFFFQDIARDQWAIWRSPANVAKDDLRWLLPIAAGAGVLISTDERTSNWLAEVDLPSPAISALGGPTNFLTAGAVYGLGRLSGNPRLAETGLLALRATGNTWMLVQAVKQGTNRERPDKVGGEGDFWHGGTSFPSGHSASTWALATVVAERYPDRKFLRVGMYALAGSVSFARLSGERHFPSDVLLGSVAGHLIGRYVVKDWRARRDQLRQSRTGGILP